MKISILCSSERHPIYPQLQAWAQRRRAEHAVELKNRAAELSGGDILFLISCHELIGADVRRHYAATLVVHASDLPQGRGWSPLVWQILEGRNDIVVTLLEAADEVDSGAIWQQRRIRLQGNELADEINALLFTAELELMDDAVRGFGTIAPRPQAPEGATYYRRRMPEDSRLDAHKTLAEQFDLLRVCDAERYPCFFDYRGRRFKLTIEKYEESE
ncbi:MAG: formyltransferase family protein [Gammaproteobacteria bacterium]